MNNNTRVVFPARPRRTTREGRGSDCPPASPSFFTLKKIGLMLIAFALGAWAGCFATGFAAGLGSLCR